MIGANKDDWKDQEELLVKFNNIQLRALTILLQAEIERRKDMVLREESMQRLIDIRNDFREV